MKIKENFFNYYILFPHAEKDPEKRRHNVIKSIALGVFTLGLVHLTCYVIYAVKMRKIEAAYRSELQQKTQSAYSDRMDTSNPVEFKVLKPYRVLKGPQIINRQELGKGHCGRYAINNAFQEEKIDEPAFLEAIVESVRGTLGMTEEDVREFVQNSDDFGVDADLLKLILERQLGVKSEIRKVAEIEGSLETYLERKDWALVCNTSNEIFKLPCETHYTLQFTRGHIAALRRDDENDWWFIDSRAEKPVCFSLALIPINCVIVVPEP